MDKENMSEVANQAPRKRRQVRLFKDTKSNNKIWGYDLGDHNHQNENSLYYANNGWTIANVLNEITDSDSK